MKQGNLLSRAVLEKYRDLFVKTVALVYNTLGETAFYLWRKRETGWSWFNRPTTVLYDPIMYVFSQHVDRSGEVIKVAERLRNDLPTFYEKNYEKLEGRYTNLSNISERNELFLKYLTDALATKK